MAAAAVLSVREPPAFEHPAYELIDGDKLQRRADAPPVKSRAEDEEEQRTVNEALVGYVTSMMVVTLGFQERWIPYEEATAKCPIYCTADWNTAPRLLIVLINQVREKDSREPLQRASFRSSRFTIGRPPLGRTTERYFCLII